MTETAIAKRVSLYEMAEAYNHVFEGLRDRLSDDKDEQHQLEEILVAELEGIEGSMEVKMANMARFLLNLEWEAEGLLKRAEALRESYKRLERSSSTLRGLLLRACEVTGRDKWEVPGVVIKRQKNSAVSCTVDNVQALPPEYQRTITEVVADKKKIVEAYKAGTVVPGATIEQGHHVRVKEA